NCGLEATTCWNTTIKSVMLSVPVVAGEFGQTDCKGFELGPFMRWMDANGGSYVAFVWTKALDSPCILNADPMNPAFDLTVDELNGIPSFSGLQIFLHYLLGI